MLSHAQLSTLTIRPAHTGDARSLRDLAQLDSASPLDGDVLVAEAGADTLAAIDVVTGRVIADPFRHTATESDLLRTRAEQIRARSRQARSRARRRALGRAVGFAR